MTDTGPAVQPDTFWVLVDELPFDCTIDDFEDGMAAGTRAGRAYLNKIIKDAGTPNKSYAGLIFDPTKLSLTPIAAFNLNGSDTSRLVNGAGKVDWMLLHPDLDFDTAAENFPWTIGRGQFRWGHAVTHRGFPGAGSGLTAPQDRTMMEIVIDSMANFIRFPMWQHLLAERVAGRSWVGGEPLLRYAEMANVCEYHAPHMVG